MVSAEGDNPGKGLALERGALLIRVGFGCAGEDAVMTFLNLMQSEGVVVPGPMSQ